MKIVNLALRNKSTNSQFTKKKKRLHGICRDFSLIGSMRGKQLGEIDKLPVAMTEDSFLEMWSVPDFSGKKWRPIQVCLPRD